MFLNISARFDSEGLSGHRKALISTVKHRREAAYPGDFVRTIKGTLARLRSRSRTLQASMRSALL